MLAIVARFAAHGKPRGLVALAAGLDYILRAMKTERDVVERLGPPDEIVRPEDRMRSRSWLCSTCRTVTTAAEPVPIPAPCTKCGGISFETVENFSSVPRKFVRPCFPTTAKKIPHDDAWQHEFDGYRFQIVAVWANGPEEGNPPNERTRI